MSVITFATSKGGAGKSTSAMVLAGELAEAGRRVIMIDADPNTPLLHWQKIRPLPENIAIEADESADTIIDTIDSARAKADFVIVDVEGSATNRLGFAISRSDSVVIPMELATIDAREAIKTVRLVKQMSKLANKEIPFAILYTKILPAIKERAGKDVEQQISEAKYPVLGSSLMYRAPFRALHNVGGTIHTLTKKDVGGLEGARENALIFAQHVLNMTRKMKAAA